MLLGTTVIGGVTFVEFESEYRVQFCGIYGWGIWVSVVCKIFIREIF